MENQIEARYRNLFLSSEIANNTVIEIIKEIKLINYSDDELERTYAEFERKPICLFINSFGGSIYDGLALVDIIKTSKTPVYTICIGYCMSMGFWIWLAGKKRLIGKNATLMFHDVSSWVQDKTEKIKQVLDESLRLQTMYIKEIISKSTIPEETLQDYINRKAEFYISAEKAIEFKLANEYYK